MDEMTDKQSKEMSILARIDELDRLREVTTDEATKAAIDDRKAALRTELTTL